MMINSYKTLNIDLLEEVVEAKKAYAKPNTIKYYTATLAKLRAFLSERGFKPSQILDYETCKAFANYLCASIKESSARAYLQQLTALFNDAYERGWIERSPIQRPGSLMPKRQAAEKGYLSEQELMALYHTPCCRESTRRAFLFSCFTGLSLADIETVEFDHIHHDGRRLVVVKPLDNSTTRIPLGRMAMGILHEIEADFEPRDDNRIFHLMDRSTITNDLRKWVVDAGLTKNVTFSYGRNTFCTLALQAGVDIHRIAYWNGSVVQSIESHAKYTPRPSGITAIDQLLDQ